MPVFTADPAWCNISYKTVLSDISAQPAINFDDDPMERKFSISYKEDLALCGLTSTDYTVTVIGSSGRDEIKVASASLTLRLKNPCIDSSYVTIEAPTLPLQERTYEIAYPGN